MLLMKPVKGIYRGCKLFPGLLDGKCAIQWALVGDKFLKYHIVLSWRISMEDYIMTHNYTTHHLEYRPTKGSCNDLLLHLFQTALKHIKSFVLA